MVSELKFGRYGSERIDIDQLRARASQFQSKAEKYKSLLEETRNETKRLKEILRINGIVF